MCCNSFSLGSLVVAQLTVTGYGLYLRRENKVKEQIISGEKEETRRVQTGDGELEFKYIY